MGPHERGAGRAAATINRDVDVVRSVMNRAARLWRHPNNLPYLDTAPLFTHVDGPRRQEYPLQWDEENRFLAELPENLRDAAVFMLHIGLRDQELCTLTWSCEVPVPELGTSVFIADTRSKNGEERVVVLNRVAREVVER